MLPSWVEWVSHHVSRGMLVELVSIHPVTMPSRPSMSTHCYFVLPFFPTLRLTLTKDWKVEWVVLPTSAWFNALQVNLYWRVSVIANCLNVPNSLSVLAKHSGSIAVSNSWRDCTNICNAKAAKLKKEILSYSNTDSCHSNMGSYWSSTQWLLLSWLLHKWKREFSDTNFEIGKPWRHFDWTLQSSTGWKVKTEAFSRNVSKVFRSQS